MPDKVFAPRLNANEDEIEVVAVHVTLGQRVVRDELMFEIQSQKSVAEVLAPSAGYVVAVLCEPGQMVRVGLPLAWIGATPEEKSPDFPSSPESCHQSPAPTAPTLKARALIEKHGLTADAIPSTGQRLGAADVEAYLSARGRLPSATEAWPGPDEQGDPSRRRLTTTESAMLRAVLWHQREAVPAYLERLYDPEPWQAFAQDFAERHGLLLDPLLGLMAFQLVQIATRIPRINATIDGDSFVHYRSVHLGFTLEIEDHVHLLVIRRADSFDALGFLDRFGELLRRALRRRLEPAESSGATLVFTSLAKRGVHRHIPVLAPRTSLIVAHSAPNPRSPAISALGATYDHRVAAGGLVARVLEALSTPAIRVPSDEQNG